MSVKQIYRRLAYFLVLFGAFNLGFKGLFKADLISSLFMSFNFLTRVIYVIIGFAGCYLLFESLRKR